MDDEKHLCIICMCSFRNLGLFSLSIITSMIVGAVGKIVLKSCYGKLQHLPRAGKGASYGNN